jgi:hypothetical protein
MTENKNHILKIITKSIKPKGNERKAIHIEDHESIGPFVRISETNKPQYIYITALFEKDIFESNITIPETVPVNINPLNSKNKNCTISIIVDHTKNKEKEESDENRRSWEIVLACEQFLGDEKITPTFNDFEYVKVEIDFGEYSDIGDPTRGTIVIPPKGSGEN